MSELLHERLRAATPEAPDLTGLADRAIARAAHERRRRTVIVGAAVLVLALAPLAVAHQWVHPGPAGAPAGCVAPSASDHDGVAGTVTEVRFCPGDNGDSARLPLAPLTGRLARMAADDIQGSRNWELMDCRTEEITTQGRTYRIQLTYDDGSVRVLEGDTSCNSGDFEFHSMLITLSLSFDQGSTPPPDLPIDCPASPRADATNHDGTSAVALEGLDPATAPMLLMPALHGYVCAYGADDKVSYTRDLDVNAAEKVRWASMTRYGPGAESCSGTGPSYVVVLGDRTGTARTLLVDGKTCELSEAIGSPPAIQVVGTAGFEDLLVAPGL